MVKHFSVDSIKSRLENQEKGNVHTFCASRYRNYLKCESNVPILPCLKHLQIIDPSFLTITKSLSNRIGEIFNKRLK